MAFGAIWNLTYARVPELAGHIEESGEYIPEVGVKHRFSAIPNDGYKFEHWEFLFSGSGNLPLPNGSTANPVEILDEYKYESHERGDLTVTAYFVPSEHPEGKILYSPSNGGRIISKGSPLYL